VHWALYELERGGLPNSYINSFCIDQDQGLWFATWGGLGLAHPSGMTPARPRLLISQTRAGLELRWRTTSQQWAVGYTDDLSAPVAWKPLGQAPTDDGTWNTVALSVPAGGRRFYSLQAP
jgi:hypothetical protein